MAGIVTPGAQTGSIDEPRITDAERYLLDVFSMPFRHEGNRVAMIRRETGMSEVTAVQTLNRLLDTERALAYSPLAVNRLRRLREKRKRSRSTALAVGRRAS